MKIGILTMNYAQNYGGVLQTYAMSQYLKEMGHEVQIVNYRNSGKNTPSSLLAKFGARIGKKEKQIAIPVPKKPLSKKYLQNFVDFKAKYLTYTQPANEFTISDVCQQFDAVIVGSDQIWNDVYTNKLAFYFDWKYAGKKIAYAACTILQTPPKVRKSHIAGLLHGFDTISVRDRNTAQYVESLTERKTIQVVDPSCLYDYHDLITNNPIGKPYILTYILSGDIKGGNQNALSIIKQHIGDIPVVSICIPSVSVISECISDVFLEEGTPTEWVNLFYHASFVYTDSFHGIMFSMKFKKPFVAYMKDGSRKSRLQDLIETYGLNNIVTDVSQIEELDFANIADYERISPLLQEKIASSKDILTKALK